MKRAFALLAQIEKIYKQEIKGEKVVLLFWHHQPHGQPWRSQFAMQITLKQNKNGNLSAREVAMIANHLALLPSVWLRRA